MSCTETVLQGTLTPSAVPGLVEPDKPTLTKRGRERAMLCLSVQSLPLGWVLVMLGRCQKRPYFM